MSRYARRPPPVIVSGRVLEYAVLPKSVKYSGANLQFVDGKAVGWVPCLAIEQDEGSTEVSLLYCDRDWTVIAIGVSSTVAQAKRRAERMYPGCTSYWKHRGITQEQAAEYLKHRWDGFECSFCERTPDDVYRLFQNGSVRICNWCVEEFHGQGASKAKQ